MAGIRAFVKVLKYKPKVEKLSKEEEKEASARATAFGVSLERFREYTNADSAKGWSALSKPHAEQILTAATRGFRFVSIDKLNAAIERSKMMRLQYPGAAVIDDVSKLNGNDLAWVTSAASQALSRAISASTRERQSRLFEMLSLTAASTGIIVLMGTIISG